MSLYEVAKCFIPPVKGGSLVHICRCYADQSVD